MSVSGKHGVVLLYSMHDVFELESVLKGAGLDCRAVPVPRHLSSDCGTAIRFNWKDRSRIEQLLEQASLDHAGFHAL